MTKQILLICSSCALLLALGSYVGAGIGAIGGLSSFYPFLFASVLLAACTCLLCLMHASRRHRWDWVVIGLAPLLLVEVALLVLLSPLIPSSAALPSTLESLFILSLVVFPWLGPGVCLIYASLSSGSPAWMVRILGPGSSTLG